MKNLLKFPVLLLVAGILCFAGCDKGDRDNDDNDNDINIRENGIIYDNFYKGDYRDNRNGTVEIVNATAHDMLIFSGSTISLANIVGGVRAYSTNTVNFSTETDYLVGGYKVLQAVKQSEFEIHKEASEVDWRALVTYRDGAKFKTNIVSTTDGNYQYKVSNRSRDYRLELRKNSPDGERVAFLERAEVNKVVKCAGSASITLFPVWITFNTETKTLVNYTPAGLDHSVTVEPKPLTDYANNYYFPATDDDVVFPGF